MTRPWQASVEQEQPEEVAVALPTDAAAAFAPLFEELDTALPAAGARSYGLSVPSLQDLHAKPPPPDPCLRPASSASRPSLPPHAASPLSLHPPSFRPLRLRRSSSASQTTRTPRTPPPRRRGPESSQSKSHTRGGRGARRGLASPRPSRRASPSLRPRRRQAPQRLGRPPPLRPSRAPTWRRTWRAGRGTGVRAGGRRCGCSPSCTTSRSPRTGPSP